MRMCVYMCVNVDMNMDVNVDVNADAKGGCLCVYMRVTVCLYMYTFMHVGCAC